MGTVKFGTVEYWIEKWKELHFKHKPGDSLTRLQMRETAAKIVTKKKQKQ